ELRRHQASLVQDLLQVLVNGECDLQRSLEASYSRLKHSAYTRVMSSR
ncbi:hypothetical protein CSUI_007234, partial [Cystoisospora suis]